MKPARRAQVFHQVFSYVSRMFSAKFKIVRMHHEPSGKKHSLLYQSEFIPKNLARVTAEMEEVYDYAKGSVVVDSVSKYTRQKDKPAVPPSQEIIEKNARFSFKPEGRVPRCKHIKRHLDPVDHQGLDSPRDGGQTTNVSPEGH